MSDVKLARPSPIWDGMGRELCERIIRRAGYDPLSDGNRVVVGGQYDDEYQMLLATLGYIGARKVDDYGDFRLQDVRSWGREVWGAYWDIQRKFGRLEQQLKRSGATYNHTREDSQLVPCPQCVGDRTKYLDDLMETLGDQAVYCMRMIQILKRLEEKGMVP